MQQLFFLNIIVRLSAPVRYLFGRETLRELSKKKDIKHSRVDIGEAIISSLESRCSSLPFWYG
jgi:hypothetical protein